MIEFSGVSFAYTDENGKKTSVFSGLDLVIPGSGITAVSAPSGAGKTTLLRLIAGLEKPQSGIIKTSFEKARISYVFQEQRLMPWFSVYENLRSTCKKDDESIKSMLSDLCIGEELYSKLPSELSGGQRQRIAIARALLFDGSILLLDEPFNGLDSENRERVMEKINEFSKDKPVILVSHKEEDLVIANSVIKL